MRIQQVNNLLSGDAQAHLQLSLTANLPGLSAEILLLLLRNQSLAMR